MRKATLLPILVAVLFSLFSTAQAQDIEKIKKILKNESPNYKSPQGREFWVAFAPNDFPTQPDHIVEIYVTSSYNTTVSLEVPGTGYQITKPVDSLKITTFSSAKGDAFTNWEIRTSEQVVDKGIHITSPDPISVYVFNGRCCSSEGYLALPVSVWGKDYLHNSYYDFKLNANKPWATGFVVIASEDNTNVTMQLKGVGGEVAETAGGHNIGDVIKERLHKGQVYMIVGNGQTRGVFDLSGSNITADKPIGVLSFHMRTEIPSWDISPGRDHLIEMVPPVKAWGKKYVTVEYKRDTDKGDFFRVIVGEDNTTFKCTYYDKDNGRVLGHLGPIKLKNRGDWFEYWEGYAEPGSPGIQTVRGTSVWESDKPIQVFQYAYSHLFDNQIMFDPFMILCVPEEQYITNTVFQTPSNKAFVDNFFNIIAYHDPTDSTLSDLKSITVDGQPIYTNNPSFLFNKIPTTDLHWAKIRVEPGAHQVKGDTKFAGYIYGFTKVDSYGWPAAISFANLEEIDTLAPEFEETYLCGSFEAAVTELRNGEDGDNPKQVDSGIESIELLEGSYNYLLKIDQNFTPWPPTYETTFTLEPENRFESAFALFALIDRASNITIDSVRYSPDSLSLDPDRLSFGTVRVGTPSIKSIDYENISPRAFTIQSIYLQKGSVYSITNGAAPPEFDSDPGEIRSVEIEYLPVAEIADFDEFDRDTLFIETECLTYKIPIEGQGVLPHIQVEDWNAGAIAINTELCKTESTGQGLKITNPGTDTLTVTGVRGVAAPFTISDPTNPAFSFKIAPKKEIYLTEICFSPNDTLEYEIDVEFTSDGAGPDSVSKWQGSGISPGPRITPCVWNERRVGTKHDSIVYMTNEGNTPTRVIDVKLEPSGAPFSIDKAGINPPLPVDLYPSDGPDTETKTIEIPVSFDVTEEGPFETDIVPVFADPNIEEGIIRNVLSGEGIMPRIELVGYEWIDPVKILETSPILGTVTIKSTSDNCDLFIESVEWADPNQTDFVWISDLPANEILPKGATIELEVEFTPQDRGRREAIVEVVSDYGPGDWDVRRSSDTVVIGYGFNTGIEVDDLDFGANLLCDSPVDSIEIQNLSADYALTVDGIYFASGDDGIFNFKSDPGTIEPDESGFATVEFNQNDKGTFDAVFNVIYRFETGELDTVQTHISGESYSVPVEVSMSDVGGLAPGWTTGRDGIPELEITIENLSGEAELTAFVFEILFPKGALLWEGENGDPIEIGSALDDTWNVKGDLIVEYADDFSALIVSGTGSTPIKSQGVVAKPKFTFLLNRETAVDLVFGDISYLERDKCVDISSRPGKIESAYCAQDFRAVIISEHQFDLISVSPNPSSGGNVSVEFSIGLEAPAKLEIFDSEGALVKTVLDANMIPGYYKLNPDLSELPSGSYTISLKSGFLSENMRIVIAK